METHLLKTFLQLQLATDASATLHLPYVLSSLAEDTLLPSSHLAKWIARINSLLHAKDAGARWSGLCLAYKTSTLSRDIMIEHAQSWMGVALPVLSKNEPIPTIKAAILLLRTLFTSGVGIPEYQRQVATPNVSKFSNTTIALVEKYEDVKLRALILKTLTQLVPIYPTLHRPLYAGLSALSLSFLNGSAPKPINKNLLEEASRLYAALPSIGGKAGAVSHWRKAVDDTLTFAWNAFVNLRTTFPSDAHRTVSSLPNADDAKMAIPLNLDRLHCLIVVLFDLLSTTTSRPVQLPLGAIVQLITALLNCTKDDKGLEHADPAVQAMEMSIVPDLWRLSCTLIPCLAKCARHHLAPNSTHLITCLVFHLERKPTPSQGLLFLSAIEAVLANCHPLESPFVLSRLIKAVLPVLSNILVAPQDVLKDEDPTPGLRKSKKGKKRARGYEGDEVFKLAREILCPTVADREALFAAIRVIRYLLRNTNLTPALQSISTRVLLSMLLALPKISPASLSPDPSFHARLLQEVHKINVELGVGTSNVMSKSLGLVINAGLPSDHAEAYRDLEILIHPRVPPLIRSLPYVESLSLFRVEESQEEAGIREEIGLHNLQQQAPEHPLLPHNAQDIVMEDSSGFTDPVLHKTNTLPTVALAPPRSVVTHVEREVTLGETPMSSTSLAESKMHPKPTVAESTTQHQAALKSSIVQLTNVTPLRQDEDDDEGGEMPVINMESDSDEE